MKRIAILFVLAAAMPAYADGSAAIFGTGADGAIDVGPGDIVILDSGDTPNAALGNPFNTLEVDPNDEYSNLGLPTPGNVTFDSLQATEFQLTSLTVRIGGTLRISGVNPVRFRVTGLVEINGVIDVAGQDGSLGAGGVAGPGGFSGGRALVGGQFCPFGGGTNCTTFDGYLNGCAPAKATHPRTLHGEGPGRGHAGGETYLYHAQNQLNFITGTGGGGAGHASAGTAGEDLANDGGAIGTVGPACGNLWKVPNSGVIGIRGVGGEAYGDAEVLLNLSGGSGGGGGGSSNMYQFSGNPAAGGGGGGGGGVIEIVAAGGITASGFLDARGGQGGDGEIRNSGGPNWDQATGGGGGGAGGSISLITCDEMVLHVTSVLSTEGGGGGKVNRTVSCTKCNEGGAGGKGYVFLMDSDGVIPGVASGDKFGDVAVAPQISVTLEDVECGDDFVWARDRLLEFDVIAADANSSDIVEIVATFDGGALPATASFSPTNGNPAFGTFSWLPETGDEGEHTLSFTATDNDGLTDTCFFTFDVTFDRDGDKLPDVWELDGYTATNGEFVDLPAMGANVGHKDVFVKIDYMQNAEFDHSPADMTPIIVAFGNAPVDNFDGRPGITMHILVSDTPVPFALMLGTGTTGAAYRWTRTGAEPETFFDDIKGASFAAELAQAFR